MTRPVVIVGVDPGGATTGVVVRAGDRCLAACSISRVRSDTLALYLEEVAAAVVGYAAEHQADGIAIEDTIAPNPHVRISNPDGIIETAKVLGAVLVLAPAAVIIRPGGHGAPVTSRRVLLSRYPAELVGPRETKGTGALRHVRSAWDVAGAARFEIRTANRKARP